MSTYEHKKYNRYYYLLHNYGVYHLTKDISFMFDKEDLNLIKNISWKYDKSRGQIYCTGATTKTNDFGKPVYKKIPIWRIILHDFTSYSVRYKDGDHLNLRKDNLII